MVTFSLRGTWGSLLAKAGSVSIKTKVMGIVATGILVSTLALVWYSYRVDLSVLRDGLRDRGIAVGNSLAVQGRDLVLTDNRFALYRLAKEADQAEADLAYVFVLDTEGAVLVHTFDEGFPIDLLGKNQPDAGQRYGLQTLETERDTIQDVAVPILGGKAGTIRLGMSEAAIRDAVMEQVRSILLGAGLVLIVGLCVAYGLSSILTKPVSGLADAVQAIRKDDFEWQTPAWAKDEIGSLGRAFNEMRSELRQKEEMRVKLLASVMTAQEEERKRVARELHDEMGQALTSLMIGLRSAEGSRDTAEMRERIIALRALAAQTMDDARRLAAELRPSLLDDLGLLAAMERYVKEYSAQMGIRVDSHLAGLAGHRLPPETEVAVYRIVQEALTNVAKHAMASNVSLVTSRRDASLIVVIEDDGVGFDVGWLTGTGNDNTLGLFGMNERAGLIGGKLTIESKPNEGATIFLEIPLPENGG